jgi:ATPase subunit of ABC transporter with duplicated ATPase domains
MFMLSVHSLTKAYGDKILFENITFSLPERGRVGLVGPNGTGKSSLLGILRGTIGADEGSVDTGGERIGFLAQTTDAREDDTVDSYLTRAFEDAVRAGVAEEWETYKIEMALVQVGMENSYTHRRILDLSGGQKTRIGLARVLISAPTVLLLDEPTNNLDAETIAWLARFIQGFDGAILVVSHDRAFMDQTVDRIMELDPKHHTVNHYDGGYTEYLRERESRHEAREASYDAYRKEKRALEESIAARNRELNALSKKKKPPDNEKMGYNNLGEKARNKKAQSVSRMESRLERIAELEKPTEDIRYPFRFDGSVHAGKFVLGAKGIMKSYHGRVILDGVDLMIYGGQRIWLKGRNGAGKTTLLRILAGLEEADGVVPGRESPLERGSGVIVGYFSQELARFDSRVATLQELEKLDASTTEIHKYARFLNILPEDLEKSRKQLSRGQNTKVEIIKLLMGQHSLLILDEPTNHLDIDAKESIENALKGYKGALLVSTHDAWFAHTLELDIVLDLEDGHLVSSSL